MIVDLTQVAGMVGRFMVVMMYLLTGLTIMDWVQSRLHNADPKAGILHIFTAIPIAILIFASYTLGVHIHWIYVVPSIVVVVFIKDVIVK